MGLKGTAPDTAAGDGSGDGSVDNTVNQDQSNVGAPDQSQSLSDGGVPTDFTQFGGGLNDLTGLPGGGALPFGGDTSQLGPLGGSVYGGGGGGGSFGGAGGPTLASLAAGGSSSLGALAGLGGGSGLAALAGPGGGGIYGGMFPGGFAGVGGGGGGAGLPNPAFAGSQSFSGGPADPLTVADLSNVGATPAASGTTEPGGQQSGSTEPDWLKALTRALFGGGSAQAAEAPQPGSIPPTSEAMTRSALTPQNQMTAQQSWQTGEAEFEPQSTTPPPGGEQTLSPSDIWGIPYYGPVAGTRAPGGTDYTPSGVGGVASGQPAPSGGDNFLQRFAGVGGLDLSGQQVGLNTANLGKDATSFTFAPENQADFQTRSGDVSFGDRFRAGFANAPGTFTDRFSTAPGTSDGTLATTFGSRFGAAPDSVVTGGQDVPSVPIDTSFASRFPDANVGGGPAGFPTAVTNETADTSFANRFPDINVGGGSAGFPQTVSNETGPVAAGTPPDRVSAKDLADFGIPPGVPIDKVSAADIQDFAGKTAATEPQVTAADVIASRFPGASQPTAEPKIDTGVGPKVTSQTLREQDAPDYEAVARQNLADLYQPQTTDDPRFTRYPAPPSATADITQPRSPTGATPGSSPNTTTTTGAPATASTPFRQTQTGAALSDTLGLSGAEAPGVGSSTYQQRGPPQPLSAQLRNMLGINNLHSTLANALGGGQMGNAVASLLLQLGVPAALVMAGRGRGQTNVPMVSGPAAMSRSMVPSFTRNITPGPGLLRWGVPLAVGQGLDMQPRQPSPAELGAGQPGGPAATPLTTPPPPIDAQGRTYPAEWASGAPEGGAPPPGSAASDISPDNTQAGSFIEERGGHTAGQGAPPLNPEFASRVQQAAMAYEAETGRRARFGETGRSYAQQAQYYEDFRAGRGGLAAPPGQSRHQRGLAVDIPDGDFQRWMHRNASRFGIEGLRDARDPDHFQMAGA